VIPATGAETILLVEDEPAVRQVAARMLTLAGYRVLEASDGVEALEVFDSAAADIALVVTDVVMPRLGGAELARRLRERSPRLRVLFTSGYTEDAMVVERLDRGQAFLQKPYLPVALTGRVRALLDADV
jgi:CheY-like chemotaxis protein